MKIYLMGEASAAKSFLDTVGLKNILTSVKPTVGEKKSIKVMWIPRGHIGFLREIRSLAFEPDYTVIALNCPPQRFLLEKIKKAVSETEGLGKIVIYVNDKACSQAPILDSLDVEEIIVGDELSNFLEREGVLVYASNKHTDKSSLYKATRRDVKRASQLRGDWIIRIVKPIADSVPVPMRVVVDRIMDGVRVDALEAEVGDRDDTRVILAILERVGYIRFEEDELLESLL